MNVNFVISYLKDHGGYTPASEPIHILDIDFHFDGVLRGPEDQDGLILVQSNLGSSFLSIAKKMRAFTLALERSGSMRIVTLVVLGNSPEPSVLLELNQMCRVLMVSEEMPLEDSLASILPLKLPTPLSPSGTADAALKKELEASWSDPLVAKLIKSARESEAEVEKAMRSDVEELSKLPKTQ